MLCGSILNNILIRKNPSFSIALTTSASVTACAGRAATPPTRLMARQTRTARRMRCPFNKAFGPRGHSVIYLIRSPGRKTQRRPTRSARWVSAPTARPPPRRCTTPRPSPVRKHRGTFGRREMIASPFERTRDLTVAARTTSPRSAPAVY